MEIEHSLTFSRNASLFGTVQSGQKCQPVWPPCWLARGALKCQPSRPPAGPARNASLFGLPAGLLACWLDRGGGAGPVPVRMTWTRTGPVHFAPSPTACSEKSSVQSSPSRTGPVQKWTGPVHFVFSPTPPASRVQSSPVQSGLVQSKNGLGQS